MGLPTPRVVDHDVEPAEGGDRALHQLFRPSWSGDFLSQENMPLTVELAQGLFGPIPFVHPAFGGRPSVLPTQ